MRTQKEDWETLEGKKKRATLTTNQLKKKSHPNVFDYDTWDDKDDIDVTPPLAGKGKLNSKYMARDMTESF